MKNTETEVKMFVSQQKKNLCCASQNNRRDRTEVKTRKSGSEKLSWDIISRFSPNLELDLIDRPDSSMMLCNSAVHIHSNC